MFHWIYLFPYFYSNISENKVYYNNDEIPVMKFVKGLVVGNLIYLSEKISKSYKIHQEGQKTCNSDTSPQGGIKKKIISIRVELYMHYCFVF